MLPLALPLALGIALAPVLTLALTITFCVHDSAILLGRKDTALHGGLGLGA